MASRVTAVTNLLAPYGVWLERKGFRAGPRDRKSHPLSFTLAFRGPARALSRRGGSRQAALLFMGHRHSFTCVSRVRRATVGGFSPRTASCRQAFIPQKTRTTNVTAR